MNTFDIQALCQGRHADAFSLLGRHSVETLATGQAELRVLMPGAQAVQALFAATPVTFTPAKATSKSAKATSKSAKARSKSATATSKSATATPLCATAPPPSPPAKAWPLQSLHPDGFFAGPVPAEGDYRLQVQWSPGHTEVLNDPYRFAPLLGDTDVWLLNEGSHLRPYEVLGATPRVFHGIDGTHFAVWAPNAQVASVVGDFNHWNPRRHPMRLRHACGVWEIFLPGVLAGARYKFNIITSAGQALPFKADPYARQAELRPATASVVALLPPIAAPSEQRQKANQLNAPISIYEVHLGSWRRNVAQGNRWLTWDELADELVPYAVHLGFTHLELMPISEHPFDGSWGYQTLAPYAPTARFGDAQGLRRFINHAHNAGLGVLLDWVPGHFPSDAHGLANFDGTHLYEYADPREGFHPDWNTLIYNYGRTEVRNFLVGNALYWLERFDADGLRVDAVASMLYRDYSRKDGEWIANTHGGRENLEAISLLKQVNEVVGGQRPQAVTMAEESTAFPAVSRPTYAGGLGFHYKWNMGWMHDTLAYMARDPAHRAYHHHELTFGLVYAFSENFVLPISHDEVVHGKGSLLAKMPGDNWQRFANLRAYLGYMWAHPGKKLLFMGCEFAQLGEWNHDQSLDWHLLDQPQHAGVQTLVRDLNVLYKSSPALYEQDFIPAGFEWINVDDSAHNVLSFVRHGSNGEQMLVLCNFSPVVRSGYRVGVPTAGLWREVLNTDAACYGGSNTGTPQAAAQSEYVPCNDRAQSVVLTLPPLATVFLTCTKA